MIDQNLGEDRFEGCIDLGEDKFETIMVWGSIDRQFFLLSFQSWGASGGSITFETFYTELKNIFVYFFLFHKKKFQNHPPQAPPNHNNFNNIIYCDCYAVKKVGRRNGEGRFLSSPKQGTLYLYCTPTHLDTLPAILIQKCNIFFQVHFIRYP